MGPVAAMARVRWLVFGLALLMTGCMGAPNVSAALDRHADRAVRHIIPPFNPALDAVHAPNGFGTGRIWHVGPHEKYKRPSDVVRLVHDGDIVEIDAATYKCDQSVRWTANDLTLIGVGGRPVLNATGCAITGGKGIWNPAGNNLIVDNIAFVGASVGSQNGAGIRYDGTGYFYVTHCYFQDNEDGILYTPNQRFLDSNNVVIDRSEFNHNGFETGQAHNMYINASHSFVLRFSYSHDSKVGHEVKSRSYANYILYNRIADEASGTASYDIDLPQGGLSYIIGNVIQKSPDADNPSNISYSVEPERNPVQRVYIAYNTIINQSPRVADRHVLLIKDKGLVAARLVDNLIVGVAPSQLAGGSGAAKVQASGNVITQHPGFYDAKDRVYNLTARSPAIDRAIPVGAVDGFSLRPQYQFAFPVSGQPRPVIGKPDVGAYEYVPNQKVTPAPTVTLQVRQNPVAYDAPAHLVWSAANATQCHADGGWSGQLPPSGEYTTAPLRHATSFGLRCEGPSGIVQVSVPVSVLDSPQAVALGTYLWRRIPDSALTSQCPSRTQYPDLFGTGDCAAKDVFATGVYVPATQKWYLMGGGGVRQYYGNEVYAFDLRTMQPQRVTDPDHIADSREYAPEDLYGSKQHMGGCDGILHLRDGRIAPAARGILGQAAYDPITRKIVVGPWGIVRGVAHCNGSTLGQNATDQWSFDPFTDTWTLLAPADDHFGSTSLSTWFLDPRTGIAYNGDGSRVSPNRGAWLIDYNVNPPKRFLASHRWPYSESVGPVAVDTRDDAALQLGTPQPGHPASVIVFNLRQLMRIRRDPGSSYRPDTTWKVTGDTGILDTSHPALTFNDKLGMFVAWDGGDAVYFMRPDYRTRTLDIVAKHIDGSPALQRGEGHDGWFTYLPDHDAYLAFLGMKQGFALLLPPGSKLH